MLLYILFSDKNLQNSVNTAKYLLLYTQNTIFKNLVESESKVPQTHSYTSNCAIKEISSCFYKLFFEFQIFFHVFHMIYSVLK